MEHKLLKNTQNISEKKLTLICLPFAGGGASAYNQWIKELHEVVTVCPVQLPGREDRIMEKPYTDMNILLRDLGKEMKDTIRGRYVLWGHSMGGKIAYELEKYMEGNGYQAQCLFVSGSRIPSLPETNPIYCLPDESFKRELGRFEGTPKEILNNQELLDFFLPMLRADFTMDETYYSNEKCLLQCPIVAFAGQDDKEASVEEIKKWELYTKRSFEYEIFQGGHFFIREYIEDVIQELLRQLQRLSLIHI